MFGPGTHSNTELLFHLKQPHIVAQMWPRSAHPPSHPAPPLPQGRSGSFSPLRLRLRLRGPHPKLTSTSLNLDPILGTSFPDSASEPHSLHPQSIPEFQLNQNSTLGRKLTWGAFISSGNTIFQTNSTLPSSPLNPHNGPFPFTPPITSSQLKTLNPTFASRAFIPNSSGAFNPAQPTPPHTPGSESPQLQNTHPKHG